MMTNILNVMRDPQGDPDRYAANIDRRRNSMKASALNENAALEQQIWVSHSRARNQALLLTHLYGNGTPVTELRNEIVEAMPGIIKADLVIRTHGAAVGTQWIGYGQIRADWLDSYAFAGCALLLLEQGEQVAQWEQLVSVLPKQRTYLFDLLVKAFVPSHALAKKYAVDKVAKTFAGPVLRALAEPAEKHSEAMARCMKGWCNSMRPWGWQAQSGNDMWPYFAYEIALAVCAYDIDDSSFCDHPYYPRDLVMHYRTHVRNTRDAWRAIGVGAGVDIIAPPPPKKADLATSKRKGIARWIELACDGDDTATDGVLDTIGKPRKVKNIDELMEQLAGENQAVHADLKDDSTVASTVGQLASARALGEFEPPSDPPAGLGRCCETLLGFAEWVQERGYTLVDLDNQDDAWCAVLVKSEYADELLELSAVLGIKTRMPDEAYEY